MRILLCILFCTGIAAAGAAERVPYDQRPQAREMIRHLTDEYGLPAARTRALLAKARFQPKILAAMRQPAEKVLPWHAYRKIFLQPTRITGGAEFIRAHMRIFRLAEKRYGVPPEVIAAIIGVETRYGRHVGDNRVLDALATLAFDYPERAAFFSSELEQFLVLCGEEHLNPEAALGSYAGAMGLPQFIASSYRHYAVDFNDNGQRDLWNEPGDIVGSVANFLRMHGWQPDAPIAAAARMPPAAASDLERSKRQTRYAYGELTAAGVSVDRPPAADTPAGVVELEGVDGAEYWLGYRNFFVITSYNHSRLYAMAVYQLSRAIASELAKTAVARQ